MKLKLPKYQYTIRDTKSGALFLSYSHSISVMYSNLLIKRYFEHLKMYGIKPEEIILQTDCVNLSFQGIKKDR